MSNFQPSYKLCLLVQRAEKLLPPANGSLNPYIEFQIQGSNQKVSTNVINNNVQPVFNSSLTLDGYFFGSDNLIIKVFNRGTEEDRSKDEVVGYASTYVSSFLLGEVQNFTVDLYKYDAKKDRKSKDSHAGDAGKLFFQIHVAQPNDTPFVNKEWNYPLYNAWLEIIDAKNCPPVLGDSADPRVSISISPATNNQQYTTSTQHSLTPVWNERRKILLDNYQSQTINISMESKNKKETTPMGQYQLPLAKCAVGHIYEDSVELSPVNGQPPAILHYKLQITAKDTQPFQFIKDKTNYEEEESVASKQSVQSISSKQSTEKLETHQISNYSERSISLTEQSTKVTSTTSITTSTTSITTSKTSITTSTTSITTSETTTQKEAKRSINLSSNPKRRTLNNSEVLLERIKIPKGISDSPCTFHVNLIEARNLQKECDPFVTFAIRSQKKDSSVNSKVIQNTQNPKWDENFDLNSPSLLTDTLVVDMYNKDPLPDNRLMDTFEIPVGNLPYKGSFVFDRDVQLKDQTTGHLNFIINPEKPNDPHCHFQWGNFDSSYSTSFTGYSHKGHSISAHSSDEKNTYHVHEEVLKELRKPKKIENITVQITGINNIPFESNDNNNYLTIQRRNKTKTKGPVQKVDDIINHQEVSAKYENVKPGNYIEVLLYQYPKNGNQNPSLVCGRRFKVKDMNFDSQPRTYNLQTPEQLLEEEDNNNTVESSNMGELKLSFSHDVTFKE